jgi:hypothetical protein
MSAMRRSFRPRTDLPWQAGCSGMVGPWGLSSLGRLTIEPSAVTWDGLGLPRLMVRKIHAVPPATLVTARLLPRGFRSGLVLHGHEGSVCVLLMLGHRNSVLRHLKAAGVPVVEVSTWVTVGTRLVRPWGDRRRGDAKRGRA